MKISPAELWMIEPPDASGEFYEAVGYLLSTGVDFAFGEGDTLPTEPPESLDGSPLEFPAEIRIMFGCWTSMEALQSMPTRKRGRENR